MKLDTFNVEVTDTFAGEANYSWVRRYEVKVREGASNAAVMRAAKRAAGYNGIRGRSAWNGGIWGEFRPYGEAVVMTVIYSEAS